MFNAELPEGYISQSNFEPANPTPEFRQTQSATNIYRILKFCLENFEENRSEWSDSLYDLMDYELLRATLVDSRQHEQENGYIYLKPRECFYPFNDVILLEINLPSSMKIICSTSSFISERSWLTIIIGMS